MKCCVCVVWFNAVLCCVVSYCIVLRAVLCCVVLYCGFALLFCSNNSNFLSNLLAFWLLEPFYFLFFFDKDPLKKSLFLTNHVLVGFRGNLFLDEVYGVGGCY